MSTGDWADWQDQEAEDASPLDPALPPPPLLLRRLRTEPVVARFRDQPFSWETEANCIHLAREQLAAFGHEVPEVPGFRTARGAMRAMKAQGVESIEALLDRHLPMKRIAPASMWLGDVCLLPGKPVEALAIYVGNSTIVAWHGNDPEPLRNIVVSNADVIAAWRVEVVK